MKYENDRFEKRQLFKIYQCDLNKSYAYLHIRRN